MPPAARPVHDDDFMDELELRRLFRSLVGPSLVSAVGLLACGGSASPGAPGGSGGRDAGTTGGSGGTDGGSDAGADPFWPDLPLEQFTSPTCEAGQWNATAGLKPSQPVDYVEATLHFVQFNAEGPVQREGEGSSGTACQTASDVASCHTAIAAARDAVVLTQSCREPPQRCQHYLLTTQGDSVRTYLPGAGYLDFLGAIDTPQEARLVVHTNGFSEFTIDCNEDLLVREVADGYQVVVRTIGSSCPVRIDRVLVHVARDGNLTGLRRNVHSQAGHCIGRRHDGFVAGAGTDDDDLGAFFAELAELEAASVPAFWHLHAELLHHGADRILLDEARRAAADEVRHAGVMAELAYKYGAAPRPARVHPLPLRPLAKLACENVVEGCVRETFGALIATYQASHAADADVARALEEIAEDETRHAALAFRVAAWLEPKLSDDARQSVRAARDAALAELRAELAHEVPKALHNIAGMPDGAVALELLGEIERSLWT
ncbi:MAG TPA: ferritin-like domain-containing protein [Polyangiaceae bacterium]